MRLIFKNMTPQDFTVFDLSKLLWALAKEIAPKAEKGKAELNQYKRLYKRKKVTDFKYLEEGGGINMTYSFLTFEKMEWEVLSCTAFYQKEIPSLASYQLALQGIQTLLICDADKAKRDLEAFCGYLFGKFLDGTPEEDAFIAATISVFINDLFEGDIPYQVKIFLTGIWLKEDEVKAENIVFRKPIVSDFEVEFMDGLRGFDIGEDWRNPTAVIQFSGKGKQPYEAQKEVEILLQLLRLFKLGSIGSIIYEMNATTIGRFFGGKIGSPAHGGSYKYGFGIEEGANFIKFYEKLKPIVLEIQKNTSSPLSIAIQRYMEAILKPQSLEAQIATAISSMEAMYLAGQERAELKRRLAQRIAILVSPFESLLQKPILEIYKDINQAYDIRSSFVHGDQHQNAGNVAKLTQLCQSVLEVARISLVIFLQIQELEKEALINKLDNALLKEESRNRVNDLVSKQMVF